MKEEKLRFWWSCIKVSVVLSSLPKENSSSCSRGVWLWILFHLVYSFFGVTFPSSSSSSSSLFPLPLNMYSNYTETAADLYIVFGSNSMERLGTVANLVSLSPLLCKFIKGGRGVVQMFTKL